jgi:hypothetical protein
VKTSKSSLKIVHRVKLVRETKYRPRKDLNFCLKHFSIGARLTKKERKKERNLYFGSLIQSTKLCDNRLEPAIICKRISKALQMMGIHNNTSKQNLVQMQF